MRDCNIPFSGQMVHAKVEEFSEKRKINEFKFSMCCFEVFKNRTDLPMVEVNLEDTNV